MSHDRNTNQLLEIPPIFANNVLDTDPLFFERLFFSLYAKSATSRNFLASDKLPIITLKSNINMLINYTLRQLELEYKLLFWMFNRGASNTLVADSNTGELPRDVDDSLAAEDFFYRLVYSAYGNHITIESAISQLDSEDITTVLAENNGQISNTTINLPTFAYIKTTNAPTYFISPLLVSCVAVSMSDKVIALIDAGADINKYSLEFGNNSILLATAKGWNHIDPDRDPMEKSHNPDNNNSQRKIIEKLLAMPNLVINTPHLKNGMTALHLACLRGDDPDFIKLLVQHGANVDCVDLANRRPEDYLGADYKTVKKIIAEQFGGIAFKWNTESSSTEVTLPTPSARESNIRNIKILLDNFRKNNGIPVPK
jgi:hypothetical protein